MHHARSPLSLSALAHLIPTALAVWLLGPPSACTAAPLTLAAVQPSPITLRITPVGSIAPTNATSPFPLGGGLVLIDQNGALTWRSPLGISLPLLSATGTPQGLSLVGEKILNAATNAEGNTVYVTFTSATAPPGTPISTSPRGNADAYQVVYRYNFDGTALSSPTPLRAFEVYRDGHTGGGMLVAPDGTLILAFGDNGDAGEDGRAFAQDDVSHLSKLVKLDPETGVTTILAKGVRNPQRLAVSTYDGIDYLSFVDIGGSVAEELDLLSLASLLNTQDIENFGWGRSSLDGHAREGTFYINSAGAYLADAPISEAGYIQPFAQWGREGATFFAGTGPAACSNLNSVDYLFGDLSSGRLYGTTGGEPGGTPDPVYQINLVDQFLTQTSLTTLASGRPDPRFFCYGNGKAGVLLEATGAYFLLEDLEPASALPEPGSLWLSAAPAVWILIRKPKGSPTQRKHNENTSD